MFYITATIMIELVDDKYEWLTKEYFDIEIYEQSELYQWYVEFPKLDDDEMKTYITNRILSGHYDHDLTYKKLKENKNEESKRFCIRERRTRNVV